MGPRSQVQVAQRLGVFADRSPRVAHQRNGFAEAAPGGEYKQRRKDRGVQCREAHHGKLSEMGCAELGGKPMMILVEQHRAVLAAFAIEDVEQEGEVVGADEEMVVNKTGGGKEVNAAV